MEKKRNIYESGQVAENEQKRLRSIEYPTQISEEVLGADIKGKTVLDLGSGPNDTLGKFAREHGASYVAFDIHAGFLKKQRESGSTVVQGDIERLPFKEKGADIVHERFVLMHLLPDERRNAIRGMINAAKERAEFLEWDWGTVDGDELTRRFRDFAIQFMRERGIEPLMGQKLKKEIEEVAAGQDVSIAEQRHNRGPEQDYAALIAFIKSMKEVALNMGNQRLAEGAEKFIEEFKRESKKENPGDFTGSDIVAVEVLHKASD